ncbi:E3 ubiquitin-protein ligase TRIM71-like [Glandiceps talaboti]
MATSVDLQKFLNKMDDDFVSCSICLERYDNPKVLACLHTFCEKCLLTLVRRSRRHGFDCPTCGMGFDITADGVRELKGNFFMNSLVDLVAERRMFATAETERKCEFCEEDAATHICVECPQYFCNTCVKSHQKIKATRSHEVTTIQEYMETNSCIPNKMIEYCNVHKRSELKFYCDTCTLPVCTDCTIVDHRIPGHRHRNLDEVAREYREELVQVTQRLQQQEQRMKASTSGLKTNLQRFKVQCGIEENNIHAHAEDTIHKVKKEEGIIVDRLKAAYRDTEKEHKAQIDRQELNHGNIESTRKYIDTLTQFGGPAQLLSTKQETLAQVNHLMSLELKSFENDAAVEFKPNPSDTISLGSLVSDACVLKSSVENIPKEVVKGESTTLTIVTRDSEGREILPRQKLAVKIGDRNLDLVYRGGGNFKVTFFGAEEGKQQISVTLDKQPLRGTPLQIKVVDRTSVKRQVVEISTGRSEGITVQGNILKYQHGASGTDAVYIAANPLTPENNYFEMYLLTRAIAIGLVHRDYSLQHQPGWDGQSIGYHADDGSLYRESGLGQRYGKACRQGDRIGCGIKFDQIRYSSKPTQTVPVFFTRNGKELKTVMVTMPDSGFFPAIGLDSIGDKVCLDLSTKWPETISMIFRNFTNT